MGVRSQSCCPSAGLSIFIFIIFFMARISYTILPNMINPLEMYTHTLVAQVKKKREGNQIQNLGKQIHFMFRQLTNWNMIMD